MTTATAEPVTNEPTTDTTTSAETKTPPQCVINLPGNLGRCPEVATVRAFVSCDNGHERTSLYCDEHAAKVARGLISCGTCPLVPITLVYIVIGEPIR